MGLYGRYKIGWSWAKSIWINLHAPSSFTKGQNFCNLLLAYLDHAVLPKESTLKGKKRILVEQILFLKVDAHWKGMEIEK